MPSLTALIPGRPAVRPRSHGGLGGDEAPLGPRGAEGVLRPSGRRRRQDLDSPSSAGNNRPSAGGGVRHHVPEAGHAGIHYGNLDSCRVVLLSASCFLDRGDRVAEFALLRFCESQSGSAALHRSARSGPIERDSRGLFGGIQ